MFKNMEQKNEFELEKLLIIISVPTIKKLLSYGKIGADALLLYNFYYYTAKRQGTNQPRATPNFCMKGLHWGRDKFKKADKILRELKLIKKVVNKDKEGKIAGWYVKINYLWTNEKEKEVGLNRPEGTNSRGHQNRPCGNCTTNALSVKNLNALSVNNKKSMSSVKTDDEPFSFKNKLNSMFKDKRRHINIIALYWKHKNFEFDNEKQYRSALARDLKPASKLVGYSDEDIIKTFKWLDGEEYLEKWTLETAWKYIDEVRRKEKILEKKFQNFLKGRENLNNF